MKSKFVISLIVALAVCGSIVPVVVQAQPVEVVSEYPQKYSYPQLEQILAMPVGGPTAQRLEPFPSVPTGTKLSIVGGLTDKTAADPTGAVSIWLMNDSSGEILVEVNQGRLGAEDINFSVTLRADYPDGTTTTFEVPFFLAVSMQNKHQVSLEKTFFEPGESASVSLQGFPQGTRFSSVSASSGWKAHLSYSSVLTIMAPKTAGTTGEISVFVGYPDGSYEQESISVRTVGGETEVTTSASKPTSSPIQTSVVTPTTVTEVVTSTIEVTAAPAPPRHDGTDEAKSELLVTTSSFGPGLIEKILEFIPFVHLLRSIMDSLENADTRIARVRHH